MPLSLRVPAYQMRKLTKQYCGLHRVQARIYANYLVKRGKTAAEGKVTVDAAGHVQQPRAPAEAVEV